MSIPQKERSEYFRGLLLLIGKDQTITDEEAALLKRVGRILGFDQEFCDNAIREVLENEHIAPEPPLFSSSETAEHFIRDGLTFAHSDTGIQASESDWLERTAERNGLTNTWFRDELASALRSVRTADSPLEAERFSVL